MTELEQLARDKAKAAHLNEALVCAICEHESKWNPWLSRYEPGFFARYLDNSTMHLVAQQFAWRADYPVSFETELRERSFSRGLMQVMGQVARERGFTGPLPQLHDPAINLEIGCKQLALCLARMDGDVRRALLRWNGGGDPNYPDKVLALVDKYHE